MNEFKRLCERVLEEIPAPPGSMTGAQMLALARDSARRRSRLRLLLLSCVLLGVAGVAGLLAGTAPQGGPPPAATPAVQWAAHMPPPEAVASHSHQAADAVNRVVPMPVLSPSWTMIIDDGTRRALRLLLYSEGEVGYLTVYFQYATEPPATQDLCAPDVGAQIIGGSQWGPIDLCYELTVNEQPIRVAVGEQLIMATRFLRDGFVTVVARQDMAGPVASLTPRQVAQVAADPDLLPGPVRR